VDFCPFRGPDAPFTPLTFSTYRGGESADPAERVGAIPAHRCSQATGTWAPLACDL